MAKRKPAPDPRPATLTAEQALPLIKGQRAKGQQLLEKGPISSAAETAWETVTRDVLTRAFGEGSSNVSSVMDIGRYGFAIERSEREREEERAKDMADRLVVIDGLIEMLETDIAMRTGSRVDEMKGGGKRVFLVHGHDERLIHETARFIEKLGPEVVILREQPNSGRTIIEKFVDYSDVGFAVVLLTADDRGGIAAASFDAQKPRARQNVILELGFFLGRLGRMKVGALYQEGVEIPSDYSGVLFTPLDQAGAWRLALAKEMKAAGLLIDMNKAV